METKNKVIAVLKTLSGKESIRESDRLQEDLSLDSLSMVTILLEIEEAFGILLEESDMDPFLLLTVEDVIALADRYQKTKKSKRKKKRQIGVGKNEAVE